jgi:carboxynorspermidine decarboxylase
MDYQLLKNSVNSTPAFILDETQILLNLQVLDKLRQQSGCKLLYSIKALPFSALLEIIRPFVDGFSVSSLFEARLSREILPADRSIHLTTPGVRPDEIAELSSLCTHISFNSLSQYQRYAETAKNQSEMGLRLNPKLSFLSDDRFNPCRKYSKLGVDIDDLWQSSCLDHIKGLHIHTVFSATDFTPLIKTIDKLRSYFGNNLAQLDWLNLGGGYLFAQIPDHQPFIDLVNKLKNDFELEVFIEPGKAIVGNTGHLVASVIDSFVSDGKNIAVLDTSINHNPEVFEYQRQPELHEHNSKGLYSVFLVGCTCLAGDVFGEYRFNSPLKIGDKVVFKQLGAYSLIKANRFNGFNLPVIGLYRDTQTKIMKQYTYQDYLQQWLAD